MLIPLAIRRLLCSRTRA